MKHAGTSWVSLVLVEYEQALILYAAHITRDIERARDVLRGTFLKLCRQMPDPNPHISGAIGIVPKLCAGCGHKVEADDRDQRCTDEEQAPSVMVRTSAPQTSSRGHRSQPDTQ
jgi:hypothetical protein